MPTHGYQSKRHNTKESATGSGSVAELARRGKWADVHDQLAGADRRKKLGGDDLERLGEAAYMLGREEEFIRIFDRAYQDHLRHAKAKSAARCGFWIGLILMFRGEFAKGNGWLTRANRLVADLGTDCAEQGYLLLPRVEQLQEADNSEEACKLAGRAAEIGQKFKDWDLQAIARHLQGRIKVVAGDTVRGFQLLDEAMVSVVSGNLSPMVTGLVYCSVIETCQKYQAVGRAREWTSALADWCAGQPEIVAFTGRCLIHRAEILILDGNWEQAGREAGTASARLRQGPKESQAGPAYYQAGEVFRLCGEWDKADGCYRSASRLGFDPQPGLALMRLRQGNSQPALSAIRRALRMVEDAASRLRLLPAAVEIALAAGELDEAGALCECLDELGRQYPSELVLASVGEARARLFVGGGRAELALPYIAGAMKLLLEIHVPYRLACLRTLLGQTCLAIGDIETAHFELSEAFKMFRTLGARPDELSASQLIGTLSSTGQATLTERQLQVLRLIAAGSTNPEIALKLGLSPRTVDRHVSNILTRLDVPTRAAATAYAFEHRLIKSEAPG